MRQRLNFLESLSPVTSGAQLSQNFIKRASNQWCSRVIHEDNDPKTQANPPLNDSKSKMKWCSQCLDLIQIEMS